MDDDCYIAIPKSHLRQCINTIANYLHDGRDKADLAIACEMLHADSQQGPTLPELREAEQMLRTQIERLDALSHKTTNLMWFQSSAFLACCAMNVAVFWTYGASIWAYVSQVLAFAAIGIITLRARKTHARHRRSHL
jgi:hypothetical protein